VKRTLSRDFDAIVSRRDCLTALVGGAAAISVRPWHALRAASAPAPSAGRGTFLVRGQPVFLVSGSLDYFRCPRELWRDRLLKARRGGQNCIASCIAWNFHETEEGRFNFSGDRDLGHFIDLCGEMLLQPGTGHPDGARGRNGTCRRTGGTGGEGQ